MPRPPGGLRLSLLSHSVLYYETPVVVWGGGIRQDPRSSLSSAVGGGKKGAGRGCLTSLETALLCHWPLLYLPMGPSFPAALSAPHPTLIAGSGHRLEGPHQPKGWPLSFVQA